MRKQFLEAGKIVGTHGVAGEMKVEPWTDAPEVLLEVPALYFSEGREALAITGRRIHKRMLLLKTAGVTSIEDAQQLRGRKIYLNRDDILLEAGQAFLEDLIGMTVVDGNTDRRYGVIQDVLSTGANDVYRIVDDGGKTYLFPAVQHMIKSIDYEGDCVFVLPIPGIFDDEVISDAH